MIAALQSVEVDYRGQLRLGPVDLSLGEDHRLPIERLRLPRHTGG